MLDEDDLAFASTPCIGRMFLSISCLCDFLRVPFYFGICRRYFRSAVSLRGLARRSDGGRLSDAAVC